jgi:hypothetical protein
MDSRASYPNPVQRFAEMMAALADPFAERASVLSAAGHDAASWARVEQEWTRRIEQDSTGDLGAAFANAFAQANCPKIAANDGAQTSSCAARFSSAAAQPWRQQAAAVQLDASGEAPPLRSATASEAVDDTWPSERDLDRTAELRIPRAAPVLPFSTARPGEHSGVRPAPARRRIYEPPIRPAPVSADVTLEIPTLDARAPVLPFEAPRPVGRLHRFDTQTGLPLANPIWIDEAAADPSKSA